eukprot:1512188-Pleurochrysis_carterae.AAC.1
MTACLACRPTKRLSDEGSRFFTARLHGEPQINAYICRRSKAANSQMCAACVCCNSQCRKETFQLGRSLSPHTDDRTGNRYSDAGGGAVKDRCSHERRHYI